MKLYRVPNKHKKKNTHTHITYVCKEIWQLLHNMYVPKCHAVKAYRELGS
jgi:hypothetical protein